MRAIRGGGLVCQAILARQAAYDHEAAATVQSNKRTVISTNRYVDTTTYPGVDCFPMGICLCVRICFLCAHPSVSMFSRFERDSQQPTL